MTGPQDYYSSLGVDPAEQLEREKRRLDEVTEVWRTETTTVRSKDQSFSMTLDGRGDLTDITFHGTKYRGVAPAELASLLVSTLQAARLQSMEKIAATMADAMPGFDFMGLATGKVDAREVLSSLIEPLFDDDRLGESRPAPSRNGWEA